MAAETNNRTGQEYYAYSADSVLDICKALNVDGGRLQQLEKPDVRNYMDMVEHSIDGYLEQYYFVPIRPYNHVMPDGNVRLTFPGRIRRLAQYWSAGLLLTSEFQGISPNSNESAMTYIEDSRKELYQITLYNQRIPGQRLKSDQFGRTMLPTMQPGMPPTEMW